ncbi:DNA starvation/stationary phase protection protein [Rhodococcus zopfii]|uniref:DNA starvation/stationary phase protection protein n=1 Tax=Rhodococcus zopfii TaxID=43772 RepID=A0ABU3WU16_9NOCA|nr:DNA starvation/stationary phase protection protein [Rhodococcus zopfii]MDV2477497.1 DNA starvation/stationary phase protection protein [Rhodococcus zopfii]
MKSPITSTLDPARRDVAAAALQAALVDLVDLSLIGKQAHWTVVGPQFRSIHLALDELVTAARDFADQAAERLTAVGVAPDGRAATVARESAAKGFGDGWTKGEEVVAAIVDNIAAVVSRLRAHIDATADADPVTQDLLIGQTARLEQLHWMWQAQLA